jgi:cytosine/adenosine deaminase-related metal-dependent hydrolase
MRKKISANYIYTGHGEPLKYGIVELDDKGVVTRIIDTSGQMTELANMEFYSGIIVPGFVNAHCHLELSHLRGKTSEGNGLTQFVREIGSLRNVPHAVVQNACSAADAEMYYNGIVAIGDIANRMDSLATKQASKLWYHTFVEVFGLDATKADAIFEKHIAVYQQYKDEAVACSLTPHAPYSLSEALLGKVLDFCEQKHSIVSLHSQESAAENQLFAEKAGPMFEGFMAAGFDLSRFEATGNSSMHATVGKFNPKLKTILVHNTHTSEADIELALSHFQDLFWCLCPSSNLYIDNALPPVDVLRLKGAQICLGTDSLASNHHLSILDEMVLLHEHFPEIPFQEMLEWATLSGAKALGIEAEFGTIELGKRPGLVLIHGFDFSQMHLTPDSFSRRIF